MGKAALLRGGDEIAVVNMVPLETDAREAWRPTYKVFPNRAEVHQTRRERPER